MEWTPLARGIQRGIFTGPAEAGTARILFSRENCAVAKVSGREAFGEPEELPGTHVAGEKRKVAPNGREMG